MTFDIIGNTVELQHEYFQPRYFPINPIYEVEPLVPRDPILETDDDAIEEKKARVTWLLKAAGSKLLLVAAMVKSRNGVKNIIILFIYFRTKM